MTERNESFFTYVQNNFLVCLEQFGESKALDIMAESLQRGLKAAYDSYGFNKGNPHDFARLMQERDSAIGLKVDVQVPSENEIIYRFCDDPFPKLKAVTTAEKVDSTYMPFKVKYILGDNWTYITTKHLWRNDGLTEHIIRKIR